MSLVDVSAHPLNVVFNLFYAPLNEAATQNNQYTPLIKPLVDLLPVLPANLKAGFGAAQPFITMPLGVLFNNNWLEQLPSVVNLGVQQFQAAAASGGQGVSNVSCFLPPLGAVLAGVTPAQGATPGSLVLDFNLQGGFFHFYSGPLGAGWKLTFTTDLTILTQVPTQPFGFAPQFVATLSNAQMSADNVGADIDQFLDNFFTDLGNFFTGGNYVSDVDWAEQIVAQSTDRTQPLPASTVAPVQQLFTMLDGLTPDCLANGFTQCAFSIASNNQLTLTVTHPLDPGPVVQDAYHPQGVLVLPPQLAATAPEATPGSTIGAIGTYFPVDTTTSLSLTWPNTSSGNPTGAELLVNGQKVAVPAPAGSNPSLVYVFNPTGLTPGKNYSFEARCGDALTWSQWGPTFQLATAPTNIADLVLTPTGGGQNWTIGQAALPPAKGTWKASGTIPAAVPPGSYYLQAVLGGSLIAETTIQIASSLSAMIEVIDPSSQAVIEAPIWGAQPFTLRGFGFPDGPVTITFNGAVAAPPVTAAGGVFTANLTTPGTLWTEEQVDVTATGGAVMASLNPPIYLEGQPQ